MTGRDQCSPPMSTAVSGESSEDRHHSARVKTIRDIISDRLITQEMLDKLTINKEVSRHIADYLDWAIEITLMHCAQE